MSIAFLSTPAKAQYNNNISANPFALLYGVFNITYEHKIDNLNSFTVFLQSYNTKYVEYWTGYGIGGSYRWYISPFKDKKRNLEGFSFGPVAVMSFWKSDYPQYKIVGNKNVFYENHSGSDLSIGGEAAYKWVWDGFSLEPSINLMLDALTVDGRDNGNPLFLNLKIGYAW
jgi:hypothetical protein